MPQLLQYLVKFSIGIVACAFFYQFILRSLTFYKLNRWFLLLGPLISLLIPALNIAPVLAGTSLVESPIIITLSTREISNDVSTDLASNPLFTFWKILLWFLLAGMVARLIALIIRYRALLLFPKGKLISEVEGIRLYDTSEQVSPFSYRHNIIINSQIYTRQELQGIICHETIHIRQRHTCDVLYAEILCIVNWFNPFAWFLRRSIRQNLEFIADSEALKQVRDRPGYKALLLKAAGIQAHELANAFNVSLLRLRLQRMNRPQSSRSRLLRLIFLFPMIACLLLAFCRPGSTAPVLTNNAPLLPPETGKPLLLTESDTNTQDEKEAVWKTNNNAGPGSYYIIVAGSAKEEVKKLKQIFASFQYDLTIEEEAYVRGKLVHFSGQLSGKPFDDDLTHSMRFNIVTGGVDKIGCHTKNGRLYAMTTNTLQTSKTE